MYVPRPQRGQRIRAEDIARMALAASYGGNLGTADADVSRSFGHTRIMPALAPEILLVETTDDWAEHGAVWKAPARVIRLHADGSLTPDKPTRSLVILSPTEPNGNYFAVARRNTLWVVLSPIVVPPSATLTENFIGYGDSSNLLTGASGFRYLPASRQLSYRFDATVIPGPRETFYEYYSDGTEAPGIRVLRYGGTLAGPGSVPAGASIFSINADGGVLHFYFASGNREALLGWTAAGVVINQGLTTVKLNGPTLTSGTSSIYCKNSSDDTVRTLTIGANLEVVSGTLNCTVTTGPTGPTGPTGATGATGAAGPNVVNGSTTTTLTGILKGDGANVGTVTVGTGLSYAGSTLSCTVSGLTDGDKGDISVSGSGATWTIDADSVTYAKLQNASTTSRILARKTAGAGDYEECSLSDVLDMVGSPANGDMLYRWSGSWTRLPYGTSGNVLKTGGSGSAPFWDQAMPAGVVMMWAGDLANVPSGWLPCDGASVSSTNYLALHSFLSNTYGGSAYTGAGGLNFNLPDMRGRAPIGAGTGSGLTARNLGASGGAETHALTSAENGPHTHGPDSGAAQIWMRNFGGGLDVDITLGAGSKDGAKAVTGSSGSGTAHNNMQPWRALHFIIKT